MSPSKSGALAIVLALCFVALVPPAAANPLAPRIESFTLSTTTLGANDTLTITSVVSGPTPSQLSFGFYLGSSITMFAPEGTTPDGNGSYLSSATVPWDQPGGLYTLGWTYTSSGPGQSHQDYENVTYPDGSPVTIRINTSTDVDLRVDAMQARPLTGGVEINARFANHGNGTSAHFMIHFLVDGNHVYGASQRLPAHSSVFYNTTVNGLAPGNHTFTARADPWNDAPETNESNNDRTMTFLVADPSARPDLTTKILVPSNATAGQKMSLAATVRNGGNATAGSSTLRLAIDGDVLCLCSTPALAPGENVTLRVDWTASAGSHTAAAQADWSDEVAERNESNNAATLDFTVAPPAVDLIADLAYVPNVTREGSTMYVVGRIINLGNASAQSSVAHLYVDGEIVASRTIPSLAPGQWAYVSAAWNTTYPGYHGLALIADVYGDVEETNEGNNGAYASFYVFPVQDVSIEIVSIVHEDLRTDFGSAPNPAGRRIITVEVTNHDERESFVTVDIWAGATLRHHAGSTSANVATEWLVLDAGETRRIELEWDPLAVGDVTLEASIEAPYAYDPDRRNNRDTARDFVVVGGMGGLVVG